MCGKGVKGKASRHGCKELKEEAGRQSSCSYARRRKVGEGGNRVLDGVTASSGDGLFSGLHVVENADVAQDHLD